MVMFLMILLASVPVLLFCCLIVAGAARRDEAAVKPQAEGRPRPVRRRFFAPEPSRLNGSERIPIEVLLSQIENHVRMEQAAAESFLEVPTPDSLHQRSGTAVLN